MSLCFASPLDPSVARLGWHPGNFSRPRDLAVSLRRRASLLTHPGYDFMADPGAPVLSGLEGTVARVAYRAEAPSTLNEAPGNYVVVRTERGSDRPLWVHYWGLDGIRVAAGQPVTQGDLLGRVGSRGRIFVTFSRFGPDPVSDPLTVLSPSELGFLVEGAEQPPVRIGDWTSTPAFGGRFVVTCAPLRGIGLGEYRRRYRGGPLEWKEYRGGDLGSSLEYTRYGRTRLSNHRPYDPEAAPRTGGSGVLWGILAFAGIALIARATVR